MKPSRMRGLFLYYRSGQEPFLAEIDAIRRHKPPQLLDESIRRLRGIQRFRAHRAISFAHLQLRRPLPPASVSAKEIVHHDAIDCGGDQGGKSLAARQQRRYRGLNRNARLPKLANGAHPGRERRRGGRKLFADGFQIRFNRQADPYPLPEPPQEIDIPQHERTPRLHEEELRQLLRHRLQDPAGEAFGALRAERGR